MYDDTTKFSAGSGPSKLPPWVDGDYLRYYVLVHDEENDDISRSTSLYNQMKRHFGLHCHLLRIRSSRSVRSDDDSISVPRALWVSATEERQFMAAENLHSPLGAETDSGEYGSSSSLFESDVTAICSFVRELVTRSLLPTMERQISIWNDQVASRRRGLTGRFMSLSRKWTGLAPTSRLSAASTLAGGSQGSTDALGNYLAQCPEAIMRKLADWAFMLHDWKLASSIYELLLSDHGDAKAWKYSAAANEMAAVSMLLLPVSSSAAALASKSKLDTIEIYLESAFYSYKTRCGQSLGALKAALVGIELLRSRRGTNIDYAIRLGSLLLESKILGPIGDCMVKERLAVCLAEASCRVPGDGPSLSMKSRKRKSGLWAVMATEAWIQSGNTAQASRCINYAKLAYGISTRTSSHVFGPAVILLSTIMSTLKISSDDGRHPDNGDAEPQDV